MSKKKTKNKELVPVVETYAPMPGSRISGEQAVIIGSELKRIDEERGAIKPEYVVEKASDKSHPMHNMFTWDDTEAANAYRVEQARTLIRSVRIITVDVPKPEQVVVRAFINVTASDNEKTFDGSAYVPMYRVMQSQDYKQQVLNRAMNQLREWKRRYEDYRDYFGGVFSEIEKVKMIGLD